MVAGPARVHDRGMRTASSDYRAGDADRETVVDRLKVAYADGRLDRDAFDLRLERAMTARTAGELWAVVYDLDRPAPTRLLNPDGSPLAPPTDDERLIAALAQATGVVPVLVGPALVLATAGRRSAFVRHHAAGALNFQLTLLLVAIVTFGLGAVLYAVAWIVAVVAAVVALTGSTFRYPWVLRVFGRHGPYPTT